MGGRAARRRPAGRRPAGRAPALARARPAPPPHRRPPPHPARRHRRRCLLPLSGLTVHQHLAALYRRAAEELERVGRIDEAAFVLADLLDAPAEAVALLDRHGRSGQAAELAEGRDLAADLVVRLWWQAGAHERALRIAHRRAAFAAAVGRLAADDPAAGRELRRAWAAHSREAGDHLGAVEALWPDEALRPLAAADLRDAVALGGPTRGRALPYLLALGAGRPPGPSPSPSSTATGTASPPAVRHWPPRWRSSRRPVRPRTANSPPPQSARSSATAASAAPSASPTRRPGTSGC
ncbi:hypothetical protein ACFQ0M_44090 [Kitasatospora aburaviensis]